VRPAGESKLNDAAIACKSQSHGPRRKMRLTLPASCDTPSGQPYLFRHILYCFPLRDACKSVAMPKTKPTKSAKPASKRKPNAAFMKPVQPDDKLAAIVGSKPLPRSELTKKLWDYIKKNKLQDAKKKTLINADDALKAVFNGKKQVSMFEMTKLVSGHIG